MTSFVSSTQTPGAVVCLTSWPFLRCGIAMASAGEKGARPVAVWVLIGVGAGAGAGVGVRVRVKN